MNKNTNHIGYACMNLDTRPSSFRTCRLQNLSLSLHRELVEHNLNVLEAMIDYNVIHGVRLYRISSSLIPFASSGDSGLDWKKEFGERLARIGKKIASSGMRVSVHPGQYTVINSPRREVAASSVRELEYHADILEALGTDASCKIVLHIGGVYGDKEASLRRFSENYTLLPSRIRDRLVIENDDKLFNIEDVLRLSKMTGAPVIYDNLHHKLLPSLPDSSEREILEKVAATWEGKGKPKMHYSQQAGGKPAGAHSATIDLETFIADYSNVYCHFDIDIMLEVKDKNRSFKKADLFLHPSAGKIQEEWARYKYLVMSVSYEDYRRIRNMFQNQSVPSAEDFFRCIDASLEKEPSLKNRLNTFEHVWGYFRDKAERKEKERFFGKLAKLKSGRIQHAPVGRELFRLAEKYGEDYLLSSYFLKQYSV